jgi:acyl carrier protein
MSNEAMIKLLEEALEVDPGSLKAETLIEDVPEWTSIGWLTVMSVVDEQLGVTLSAREIRNFKTVQDVLRFLHMSAKPQVL